MSVSPMVITLYPNAFGMGYVISETPKELINYGIARVRPLSKNHYVKLCVVNVLETITTRTILLVMVHLFLFL